MKRFFLFLLVLSISPNYSIHAQQIQELSAELSSIKDVCLRLRTGVEQISDKTVQEAYLEYQKLIEKYNIGCLTLNPEPKRPQKNDAHLIYTPDFFKRWLAQKDGVYDLYCQLDSSFNSNNNRGETKKGTILQRNLIVKANSVVRYRIYPHQKDYFEILVISEPFTKFSARLHELFKNNGITQEKHYNLVKRPNEGSSCVEYALSYNGLHQYEIELSNNTNKDISIVIFTK